MEVPILEPVLPMGGTLAADLAREGARLAGEGEPALEVRVVMSRVPLAAEALAELRAAAAAGPLVLVGLQADAFLDDVPEAEVRISAADATPLTRRMVARRVAGMMRGA